MPLVSTAEIVGAGVVVAFNVITLEHAEAIALGAERVGAAAILQISHNAVRFHVGSLHPIAAATAAVARESSARLALHFDHVEDLALLQQAADAGFSSAMFDAGALPYAENVAATAAAAQWAHEAGLWLEAELGHVGGKPGAPASAHAEGVRTDPEEAVAFVAATGVDALAVAVGSTHAMTTRSARLDHDLIAQLAAGLDVPLVLHGSSGVPDDELRRAAAAGIRKINVGTALNIAYTGAVRAALSPSSSSSSTDPRRYLTPARDAMADVVAHLLSVLSP
ncbi:MAG: fructose-bisphosphate aldolase, class [Pseudonocardiales bacterium]|jgi:fructose-bisphosphate aldolase class II|nr:fructose-bisphosphate aldolase, class [Pseudonocardiales bacterium]